MTRQLTWIAGIGTGILIGGLVVAAGATTRAQINASDISLVNSEIAKLRIAIEAGFRLQAQTEGLGLSMTAQQDRVSSLSSRLDMTRSEVIDLNFKQQEASRDLAGMQRGIALMADPGGRQALEKEMLGLREAIARAGALEQQLRSREGELASQVQQAEATWRDLMAQFQQLTKR